VSKIFFKKTFLILIIIFTTSSNADDKMALGIEVYNNKAQCGVCHTLKSAGSNGQIGPNLDVVKPTIEQIILTVTSGIGVMPSFKDTLSKEEIESLAHYIFNNTNK
tara:strand:+ start:439 stop:756 length:318 start_codon:yes stop_codon:yes gene_type:complete